MKVTKKKQNCNQYDNNSILQIKLKMPTFQAEYCRYFDWHQLWLPWCCEDYVRCILYKRKSTHIRSETEACSKTTVT